MENLFKTILNQLKTEVTELKMVAADEGQLDIVEENMYPVLFPCALIDIENAEWTTLESFTTQSGNVNITVRYCWQSPNRLDSMVSSTALTEAVARWNTHKKISVALQGLTGTNFGKLERTRTVKEKREGLIKVMAISFNCEMREDLSGD